MGIRRILRNGLGRVAVSEPVKTPPIGHQSPSLPNATKIAAPPSQDPPEETIILRGWRWYRLEPTEGLLVSPIRQHVWETVELAARCTRQPTLVAPALPESQGQAREHLCRNVCECGIWAAQSRSEWGTKGNVLAQVVGWGYAVTDNAGNWRAENARIEHLRVDAPVTKRQADALKARYDVPVVFQAIVTPLWIVTQALWHLWESRVMGGYPNVVSLPDMSRDLDPASLLLMPTSWFRDRKRGLIQVSLLGASVAKHEGEDDIATLLKGYAASGKESMLMRALEVYQEGDHPPWES